MGIKQVGEKIASSVATFFNDEKNIKILDALEGRGLNISNPDYVSGKKEAKALEDLTFVITGTLPKPRKEVEDLIELEGGHVSSAISASTDYLVVGEEPGSKLEKAKSLGVKTITYDELMRIIDDHKRTPRLF
jgi:DNA ligase (NAD+)